MNFFARMLLEPKMFNGDMKYYNIMNIMELFKSFIEFIQIDILETIIILEKLCNFTFVISIEKENEQVKNIYMSLFFDFIAICVIKHKGKENEIYPQLIAIFIKYLKLNKGNKKISFNLSLLLFFSKFCSFSTNEQKREINELMEYFSHFKKESKTHFILTIISYDFKAQMEKEETLHQNIKDSLCKVDIIKGVLIYILSKSNVHYQIKYHLFFESQSKIAFIKVLEAQLVNKKIIFDCNLVQFLSDLIELIIKEQPYDEEFTEENIKICYKFIINILIAIIPHSNFQESLFDTKQTINNPLCSLCEFGITYYKNQTDIINIIIELFKIVLSAYPNPFVFHFLKNLPNQDLLVIFTNSIISYMSKKENIKEFNSLLNIPYLLVYLFQMAEKDKEGKSPIFYNTEFIDSFDQLLKLLKETNLILTKFCFPVYSIASNANNNENMNINSSVNEYSKSIIELVFDFFELICKASNNDRYLRKFNSYFLLKKPKSNREDKNTNDKLKYYNSLMFFVDSKDIFYTTEFFSPSKLNQLNNIPMQQVNFNNVTFFFIKAFIYKFNYDQQSKHYKILDNLWKVLFFDFCQIYIGSNNNKSKNCYQVNESKNDYYNQTNKILRNFVILKQTEELEKEYYKFVQKIGDSQKIYLLTLSCCLNGEDYYNDLKKKEEKEKYEIFLKNQKYKAKSQLVIKQKDDLFLQIRKKTCLSTQTLGVNERNNFIKKDINHSVVINSNNEGNNEDTDIFSTKKNINKYNNKHNYKKKIQRQGSFEIIEYNTTNDTTELYELPEIIKPNMSLISRNCFILSPKHFFLSRFSLQFKEIYFSNNLFKKMREYYLLLYPNNINNKQLGYPSKINNFTNGYMPFIFLKQDFNFFNSKYFPISHSYCADIIKEKNKNTIHFHKKHFPLPINVKIFNCEKIIFEIATYGHLGITKKYLCFWSYSEEPDPTNSNNLNTKMSYLFSVRKENRCAKKFQIIMFYSDIQYIISRRFLLMWQGVEIHLKNGKNYFFNLYTTSKQKKFIEEIKKYCTCKIINNCCATFNEENWTFKWLNKDITTFDYLLYLNYYSSRSFCDISQYPIFPWLTNKYIKYNINSPTVYRNFKFPVGYQKEEKRQIAIKRYNEGMENCFQSLSGKHYSTSSYVFFYLMRMLPFTNSLIRLQNNKLEDPNRMFSIYEETQDIIFDGIDNRELIPEFFTCIEPFINLNCSYFGKKKNDIIVDDLQLAYSNSTELNEMVRFIINNRKILNSNAIYEKIPKWINNIFGVNQLNENAESCNIFPKQTYELKTNLEKKLKKYLDNKKNNITHEQIIEKMNEKICLVMHFGSTPHQILKEMIKMKKNFWPSQKLTKTQEEKTIENCVSFELIENNTQVFCFNQKGEIMIKNIKFFDKTHLRLSLPFQRDVIKSHCKISTSLYNYLYKYDNCIIYIKKMLITCQHIDNSIKIFPLEYKDDTEIQSIIVEDFVTIICKIDDSSFFIGLINGKIIKWKYNIKDGSFIPISSIYAHQSKVTMININNNINIMLSSSDDSLVYIRKLFDYELLQVIKVNMNFIVIDTAISNCNFLYMICFDYIKKQRIVLGYTLNGILFAQSEYGNYFNIQISKNDNIIVGDSLRRGIVILDGSTLEIKEYKYYEDDLISIKYMRRENITGLLFRNRKLIFINGDEEIKEISS